MDRRVDKNLEDSPRSSKAEYLKDYHLLKYRDVTGGASCIPGNSMFWDIFRNLLELLLKYHLFDISGSGLLLCKGPAITTFQAREVA